MSLEIGAQECKVCRTTDHLSQCSRCHLVTYCCREHQIQDWKNHKEFCKASLVKSVENLKLNDQYSKSVGASIGMYIL